MKKLFFLLMLALIYYPVQSQKIEKLLAQGKIEKAISFCEKQEGLYQSRDADPQTGEKNTREKGLYSDYARKVFR